MGTIQSYMEENKKEKSALVNTLHSLQTVSLTTCATQRDAFTNILDTLSGKETLLGTDYSLKTPTRHITLDSTWYFVKSNVFI